MMKRFKFALEPVLKHRERIEDEKQRIFAARQSELQAAQTELARLDGEFRRYSTILREDHAKLGTDDLRRYYAHLEYLDRCIVMQHAVVSQCRTAADRARTEMLQAGKDRKAIETLKQKRFAEHRSAQASAEQKELDDANARRYLRSSFSW